MSSVVNAPLVMPFGPSSVSVDQRPSYALHLWRADIDPFVFAHTARRLGYPLAPLWDVPVGMPELTVLAPLATHERHNS